MGSLDIQTFQRKVPIGTQVLIILRTGKEIQGYLKEISESHIALRNSRGEVTLLLDMIAGWETIENSNEETVSPPPIPIPVSDHTTPLAPSTSPQIQPASLEGSEPDDFSIEVITKVVEIETRFRAEVQRASLRYLPPCFSLPEMNHGHLIKQRIKTEFDRLRQIWTNAHKYNELSRLESLIHTWDALAQDFPAEAVFSFNLGCIYFQLNRFNEAIRAFYQAAQRNDADSFFNLAATALRDERRPILCYALQELFRQKSVLDYPTEWQLCVGLSTELNAIASLREVFEIQVKAPNKILHSLLLESTIFLLKALNQTREAYSSALQLIFNDSSISLPEHILSTLAKLPDTDSTNYQEEIRKFFRESALPTNIQQREKRIEPSIKKAINSSQKKGLPQPVENITKAHEFGGDNVNVKAQKSDLQVELRNKQGIYVGLPKQRGPYKEAKKAELTAKDLQKAEELYRRAISQGDNWESAIKDLANVLARQNKEIEAIELIKEHLDQVENRRSLLNLFVTFYQKIGKYDDAIIYLNELSKDAAPEEKQRILKQIAFCQIKSRQYEAAEQTLQIFLKQQPNDSTARRWLDELQQAKRTGDIAELESVWKTKGLLTEFETSLSTFLSFHLERCQYEGVRADIAAKRSFSLKDVEKLTDLAGEHIGTGRPRVRAEYYLSAAKILMDLGEPYEFGIRRNLRNFCAAMGDACVAEGKSLEFARTYYSEAFQIAPEWANQLEVKLAQFIMSFYDSAESLLRPNPTIEECLTKAFSLGDRSLKVVQELLHLSILDKNVAVYLLPRISRSLLLRDKVASACGALINITDESILRINSIESLTKLWDQGRLWAQKQQQECVDELQAFLTVVPTWDALEEQIQRLSRIKEKVLGEIDKRRMTRIGEMLEFIINYSRQTAYSEKENLAFIIQNRIDGLIKEIESAPTKISLEHLYPYVRSIQTFFNSRFENFRASSEPEITALLAVERYFIDEKSRISCQLLLYNEQDKSPASDINIFIKDSPEEEYYLDNAKITLPESLQGGDSVTVEIPVLVTKKAEKAQVFNLYFSFSYATRSGQMVNMLDQSRSIRLDSTSEFHEIDNRYSLYASGVPVEEDDMFFGRKNLIGDLLAALRNSPRNKSLVIYGQKRTGKTSVLFHLVKGLESPFIPIYLSIGQVIEDLRLGGLPGFFNWLAGAINDKLGEILNVSRPSFNDIKERPQSCFNEYMTNLQKTFQKTEGYNHARIVLLIDEFNYIFNLIGEDKLSNTFMKVWKGLVEGNYFSCIACGQDVMWKFMDRYPNEFQVSDRKRVTYLSPKDAHDLIEIPMQIPETGESRFRGAAGRAAINLIIKLTAGNPYYMQIFCSELVEYMNKKKAVYATDAYVSEVKSLLTRGAKSLTKDYFDGLFDSGDTTKDALPKNDIEQVLRSVAIGSRNQEFCHVSSINLSTTIPIEDILEDLVRRDVLESRPQGLFKIKVGIFKEWLLEHE